MEGHELELQMNAEVLKRLGFSDILVLKDYAQLDRFLIASFQ